MRTADGQKDMEQWRQAFGETRAGTRQAKSRYLRLEPSVASPAFNLRPLYACQRGPKKMADSLEALLARWHEHKSIFSYFNRDSLARRKSQRASKINGDGDGTIIGYLEGRRFCVHFLSLSFCSTASVRKRIIMRQCL